MIDGTDEFAELRANPAFDGMTDEQLRQMINSPVVVDGNSDFGMQGGQEINLGGSPSMSAINYGNSLQDPYAYNSMSLAPGSSTDYGMEAPNPYMSPAGNQFDYGNVQQLATTNSYNSMSLAPGSNIEGSNGPNQYQSAADGTFTNSYQEAPAQQTQQLTTTGPSKLLNTVSQGVNIFQKGKALLGTGGLKGLLGSGAGGAGGTGILAGLAPLAPLALGVGALLYMKNRKKKKRERQKAKEEAQYKSRKLEQKQDLIDSNTDYMEMASKYNNTYDIS